MLKQRLSADIRVEIKHGIIRKLFQIGQKFTCSIMIEVENVQNKFVQFAQIDRGLKFNV